MIQAGGFTNQRTAAIATILLAAHALLVFTSIRRLSPTLDEPAHIVAGLVQLEFRRFDVYNVNPPLMRYLCAFPLWVRGYNADWSSFRSRAGARSEFEMGRDFVEANRYQIPEIVTICRFACMPFTLVGGITCFFWSRELWQRNSAGLIALFLWCFDPNVLAHASLATADCACTALGLSSGYAFWRWLKRPGLGRAITAGVFLGLAELTKFTWVCLFLLWPALCVVFNGLAKQRRTGLPWEKAIWSDVGGSLLICTIGVVIINLGYNCEGSFSTLGELCFVSRRLTGESSPVACGNRFRDTAMARLPICLPQQYVEGIDVQMRDFENFGRPSYLRGEWSESGWWYYYLYGIAVKSPHGLQLLSIVVCVTVCCILRRAERPIELELSLSPVLLPPCVVLLVASLGTGIYHHIRYALPALGFVLVFCGVVCRVCERRTWLEAGSEPSIFGDTPMEGEGSARQ